MKIQAIMTVSIILVILLIGFAIRQENAVVASIDAEIVSINKTIASQSDIASVLRNYVSTLEKDKSVLYRNTTVLKCAAVLMAALFFLFAFTLSKKKQD